MSMAWVLGALSYRNLPERRTVRVRDTISERGAYKLNRNGFYKFAMRLLEIYVRAKASRTCADTLVCNADDAGAPFTQVEHDEEWVDWVDWGAVDASTADAAGSSSA